MPEHRRRRARSEKPRPSTLLSLRGVVLVLKEIVAGVDTKLLNLGMLFATLLRSRRAGATLNFFVAAYIDST